MKKFDIQVEFMSFDGEDEDEALYTLANALSHMGIDVDWFFLDAREVPEEEWYDVASSPAND